MCDSVIYQYYWWSILSELIIKSVLYMAPNFAFAAYFSLSAIRRRDRQIDRQADRRMDRHDQEALGPLVMENLNLIQD